MLFVIVCTDRPDRHVLRAETRAAHLAHVDALGDRVIHAGPLLDEAGVHAVGSLLVLDLADPAEAERVAVADPYARAGLFETVSIRPHRLVIRDGRRVE